MNEFNKNVIELSYKGKSFGWWIQGCNRCAGKRMFHLSVDRPNAQVELVRYGADGSENKIIAVPVTRDGFSDLFVPLKGSDGKTYLVLSASMSILEAIDNEHE